jgi:hypothetical protein
MTADEILRELEKTGVVRHLPCCQWEIVQQVDKSTEHAVQPTSHERNELEFVGDTDKDLRKGIFDFFEQSPGWPTERALDKDEMRRAMQREEQGIRAMVKKARHRNPNNPRATLRDIVLQFVWLCQYGRGWWRKLDCVPRILGADQIWTAVEDETKRSGLDVVLVPSAGEDIFAADSL